MIQGRFFSATAIMVICFCGHAHAGEWDTKSDVRVSPGMKVIKAGDANVIVAKGETPYQDSHGRIYQEPPDEYVTRGFIETNNRFKTAEAEITVLKDRFKALEDKLEETIKRVQDLEKDKPEKEI
jgi:hypothetical protein